MDDEYLNNQIPSLRLRHQSVPAQQSLGVHSCVGMCTCSVCSVLRACVCSVCLCVKVCVHVCVVQGQQLLLGDEVSDQ